MLSPAFEIAPGERTGKYNTALGTPAGEFVSAEDLMSPRLMRQKSPSTRAAASPLPTSNSTN